MSEERKNTVWPWLVAIVIGLPIMYPLSFGPYCWLDNRRLFPPAIAAQARTVYGPMFWATFEAPMPVRRLTGFYLAIWIPSK